MEAAGLQLFETGGKTVFREPCPHSRAGQCGIYENRFHICRSYECKLLGLVKNGEISVDGAIEKIGVAKKLLEVVSTNDPLATSAGGRKSIRGQLSEKLPTPAAADSETIARHLLDIVALDTFLERWFRLEREFKRNTGAKEQAKTVDAHLPAQGGLIFAFHDEHPHCQCVRHMPPK